MKKIIAGWLCAAMALLAIPTAALAADTPTGSSTPGTSGVLIDLDNPQDVQLHGEVEPTIISVTAPSYIPFSMSRSLARENKAVSPRIAVQNHSAVPVEVYVADTRIDLSELNGASWSTDGNVGEKQVAVGFKQAQTEPQTLAGAQWLREGKQETILSTLDPQAASSLFVVGALGAGIPENRGFTVIATLMVHAR